MPSSRKKQYPYYEGATQEPGLNCSILLYWIRRTVQVQARYAGRESAVRAGSCMALFVLGGLCFQVHGSRLFWAIP